MGAKPSSAYAPGTEFLLGVEYEVTDSDGEKTLENFRKYRITEKEYLEYRRIMGNKMYCVHPDVIPYKFQHFEENGEMMNAVKAWVDISLKN
jgi:hypothetical protein